MSPIALQTAEIIFQFNFWPPGRKWHYLQVILSCRGYQYGCLDTLNVKINPLFQILLAFLMEAKKWEKVRRRRRRRSQNLIHIEEDVLGEGLLSLCTALL